MERIKFFVHISNVFLCIIVFDNTYSLKVPNASIETNNRESEGFRCTLPPYPDNGKWTVLNALGKPGDEIKGGVPIKFECNQEYQLTPNLPYQVCDENHWSPQLMPKCSKLCPPIYSTPILSVVCQDVTGNKISCTEPTDGTYLTYQCIQYYETLGRQQSLYCSHGTWDSQPICQPVCGKKIDTNLTPLIFNGVDTTELEYPWIVAIFIKNNGQFINNCGGTLISTRMVLTAAHCVTNSYAQAFNESEIQVAAGKYYNKYGDARDKHVQYLEISGIIVHEEFRGTTRHYQYDIALIITRSLFKLGPAVQPVCIDNINGIHLHAGNSGEIAAWGITENNTVADHLRTLIIPYKDQTTCANELPYDWADRYNFDDKICGGFLGKNKSVCRGDSGSGLVFRNPDDNRYYVHGLVSIAPAVQYASCNSQNNALFTKVSKYYQWLDKKRKMSYVEECTLPSYPNNGIWRLENDSGMGPGDISTSDTILEFSCNKGYKLSSKNPKYYCSSMLQLPVCHSLCPIPNFPPGTIVSCQDDKNTVIDCADTVSGSSIIYSCPGGYKTKSGISSGKNYCNGGSWENHNLGCYPRTESESTPTPKEINSKSSTANAMKDPIVVDTTGVKVMCTYASWWSYHGVNPEDFEPSLCTHITYDYVGINGTGDLRVQDETLDLGEFNEGGLYRRITNLKVKNKRLKVLLSVGGSKSSNASLFSNIAADAAKTAAFINSASHFIRTYKFDGLDIDWYYPKLSDKINYITFLRKIRNEFDKQGWLLSASVRSDPEDTGYDAIKMNKILDWITINTFDMYGSWSSYTGNHNALYPSSVEYEWEKNHLSVHSAANNWLNAGLTRNKMVLSVAFYGISFTLKNSSQHTIHSPISGIGPGDDNGFLRYSEICINYKDYNEVWDDEQKVSYKYKDDKWFGYNSKDAVWIKGEYVRTRGYFGVNVWPVDGDDVHGKCGTKQVLLKHLHEGIGNRVNWNIK
ncbi:unnamed protein product [Phaedon cochleariae]|uniref:Chitinase n=1 Tax=Phaedon cochleariae TaxID=80249 RepID=A0A9N9SF25_PHACE|nr:unnamed protein product [Phaedon cochleariae]